MRPVSACGSPNSKGSRLSYTPRLSFGNFAIEILRECMDP
jgi:hypothetical protein